MELLRLRVLAEEAIKSDAYHYDFADHITPELMIKLLDALGIYKDTMLAVSNILRADSRARLSLLYGIDQANRLLGVTDAE
jgi:uncharacterized ferredoxin-like protein